ncbi:MAG: tRNA (N6-isopentenyl adenosine(37)-C2)-methylthiotransferase MiaB [Armatimonadota bacterium]|nr:tRNA (N6-isopentenyl adenosine(37)-C2)-methylthiotransferase MiaB [Armatimonadota bacterium]
MNRSNDKMNQSGTFAVLTWGCQMNVDDSEQISNILIQMGYRQAASEIDADVIMLNTCSVRSKPEQKVRSKLGELRELKEQKPDLIIGVCGCMAQKEGEALRRRAPHIDMVIGTANLDRIPELISEVRHRRHPLAALSLPRGANDEARLPGRLADREPLGMKSFVPIMYGCDNFCSYCVVPYVRGKERSRGPEDVVDEVRLLAERSVKDVTLLGQNVNSYGNTLDRDIDFADLLALINQVPGIERIRFMTSHPKDLSDKLIRAIADLPKVCEHLHLPIQSGDDEILRAMRRGYTAAQYVRLVEKLRAAVPDIVLTTDLLVGFPGETEEQFENTLRIAEKVRFDSAFMFAFNPMKNTAAAAMPSQLAPGVKNARLRRLIEVQNKITVEINRSRVGHTYEVLVEGISQKESTKVTGLTRGNKTVNLKGDESLIGKLIRVRAVEGHLWGYGGEGSQGYRV